MSNINVNSIDANFPVQGQDNPSQGFRNNFAAIKTALTVAKSEITDAEDNGARLDGDNNFNGHKISNAVFNNVQSLFRSNSPTVFLANVNVQDAVIQKLTFTGNTVIRFTNWPINTDIGKSHEIKLHLVFQLDLDDPDLANYRLNFSTDQGGIIKSYSAGAPMFYNSGLGGWHLKPYTNPNVTATVNDYEHVIKAWTYNGGNTVFVHYLGSFV